MMALESSYAKNKPIELNETSWLPIWYKGDMVTASGVELWQFILGGGAGFNQLNGFFTVNNPTGDNDINKKILKQMSAFISFINSYDFVKMTRDTSFVVNTGRMDTNYFVLSEAGKQYAAYFHQGHFMTRGGADTTYIYGQDMYTANFTVALPAGEYVVQWINPEDAGFISSYEVNHTGGELLLKGPEYPVDIALKVLRKDISLSPGHL